MTLRKRKELQGCLGVFADGVGALYRQHPKWNLAELVSEYTRKTLLEDPRFSEAEVPLRAAIRSGKNMIRQLAEYECSVTLLQRNRETKHFWKDYRPCQDGIILTFRGQEATFLPSVMLDEGWIVKQECGNSRAIKRYPFQVKVFGSLLEKLGASGHWAAQPGFLQREDVHIQLYKGMEFHDNTIRSSH